MQGDGDTTGATAPVLPVLMPMHRREAATKQKAVNSSQPYGTTGFVRGSKSRMVAVEVGCPNLCRKRGFGARSTVFGVGRDRGRIA